MSLDAIREVLLWCSIINLGAFLLGVFLFRYAHRWMYSFREKWYNLTEEQFDSTYYLMMAFYKVCVVFFNIVPYVALRIVG